MISNKTQKNIVKGLVCVTVTGQVISLPIHVSAKNINEISIQNEKAENMNDFLVVGKNVFAAGKEYIDAFTKCKDIDRVTTPYLPTNYTANGILERVSLKTGKVLQRRIYDENGKAYMDIDFSSHGATNSSAAKVHKHMWENGKRGVGKQLTTEEKIKYVMIPRGYTDYDEVETKDEKQIIPITYENFKSLLINNHEAKFELYGREYTIAYAKDKKGNPKYFLTIFNKNILMGVLDQEVYYSKQELLEKKMFHGKTLEGLWDKVTVREIY